MRPRTVPKEIMRFISGIILFLAAVAGPSFAVAQTTAPPQAMMPDKHFDIFDTYCLDCHDSATADGGVDLESLSFDIDTIASAELWQKVLNVTNSGEMPPKRKDQMTTEEKTEFLADLSEQLMVARDILSDSGGVITMRRLNRREYENTIESLLGVRVDASTLPSDENPGGYDTAGSALFFSSDQFEQYRKLARKALDKAILYGDKPKVKTLRVEPETSINKHLNKQAENYKEMLARANAWRASDGQPPTEFGFIDAARVAFEEGQYDLQYPTMANYLDDPLSQTGVIITHNFRGMVSARIDAPPSPGGYFKVRARIGCIEAESLPEDRRYIEYGTRSASNNAEINVQGFQYINGTVKEPEIVEFRFQPQGSDDRSFIIREQHVNNLEAFKRLFIAHRRTHDTKLGPKPSLWVDWMEIEGPHYEQWPPQRHSALYVKRQEDDTHATYNRKVVETLARRAFRTKEPSPAYIDKLMQLYEAKVAAGTRPGTAVKDVLAIVLASPSFLYIQEPTHGKKKRELNPDELAVRLAYFLWSSPPDQTLLDVAADGDQLKQPEVIRQQTKRMLADPRADEFIHGFTHQWLHMERLDFFQFDYEKFPDYDTSIKESGRQEIYEMIKDGIIHGRPLRELVKSDHVMINNLLADYYGIDGVEGEDYRRVAVPAGLPRGGLLGTTAIMAMGSDGEKASAVERGVWILRSLLNDPPPPAPANVPQLSRLADQHVSERELVKLHQEEAQCAQCHQKIDPLGFGLQNFDAAGIWHDIEVHKLTGAAAKRAKKQGKPVVIKTAFDTSGTLPDGTAFADFYEMRDRIAEREDDFARGFTENLIEYALGRPFGFTDQKMADTVMKRAAKRDYAMDEFILAIAQSWRFKMK